MKNDILIVFADDSELVKELHENEDHQKLQKDLNNNLSWADRNNMQLNNKKFQLMQYGKDKNLKQPYQAGNEQITSEDVIKDLGTYLSSDLGVEAQIAEAVKNGPERVWISVLLVHGH